MTTLANIIKRERTGGSSRTGALFSAVGKKTFETMDPRRLFNQSGVLTALFPALKSYKADSTKNKVDAASKELSGSSPTLEQVVTKLDGLDITMRLVAKNTMAMPGMSRDMNIMRQNMVKLVRLQGGKAATKADAFFLRAFERERATEAELQASKERRSTGKSTAPTALKEKISGIPLVGPILAMITKPFFEMATNLQKFFDKFMDGIGNFFSIKGAKSLFGNILGAMTKSLGRFGIIFRSLAAGLGGTGFLAIGGLAALFYGLYKLIQADSGEAKTIEEMEKEGGYTPEQQARAAPAAAPATDDEVKRARENMRKSEDPAVRAAAAELDRQDAIKAMPNESEAERRRLGLSASSPSPSPSTSPTPATTPESTSPRLVPSLPSSELGGVNYSSYAQTVGERESGGDYKAVNSLGYLGKYQFGAMALEDMGLVKKGVGAKGQKALDDPSNWTINGGKEAFLNDPSLQEQTMLRYTKMNFERLKKLGVINDSTTAERIAGFLASAHLVGPGGAAAMSRGEIRKDAYGTSAQSYFKLGLASQDNIGPVPSSSGSQLASASTTVDSARMSAMAPASIIPAMASLASPKTPSPQKQQVNIPSTIDEDLFEGLMGRVTEYA